jgi:hypothetical protein
MRLADRLPSPDDLRRRAPAMGGFVFGLALPLVLAGLVAAIFSGGLSDVRGAPPQAYVIETFE